MQNHKMTSNVKRRGCKKKEKKDIEESSAMRLARQFHFYRKISPRVVEIVYNWNMA